MNIERLLATMRAKLQRQEQTVLETKEHIGLLEAKQREDLNRDQHPLPLNDGKAEGKKR